MPKSVCRHVYINFEIAQVEIVNRKYANNNMPNMSILKKGTQNRQYIGKGSYAGMSILPNMAKETLFFVFTGHMTCTVT